MSRRLTTLVLLFAIGGLALAGCTDQRATDQRNTEAPKPRAARTGLTNVRALDVVSGVLPVQASAPGEVTLFADGKQVGPAGGDPARFSWDTAGSPDGLVELVLRQGEKELDRKRVVVLNRGAEVFFKNGSGGKVVVPPTGYQHQHLRYHWDQNEPARKVLALLTWDQPGFDLELALGRGTCPHHGEQVAAGHGTSSPVVVTHEAPDSLPTGQWFAHVRLINESGSAVLGKETAFQVRAYVLR